MANTTSDSQRISEEALSELAFTTAHDLRRRLRLQRTPLLHVASATELSNTFFHNTASTLSPDQRHLAHAELAFIPHLLSLHPDRTPTLLNHTAVEDIAENLGKSERKPRTATRKWLITRAICAQAVEEDLQHCTEQFDDNSAMHNTVNATLEALNCQLEEAAHKDPALSEALAEGDINAFGDLGKQFHKAGSEHTHVTNTLTQLEYRLAVLHNVTKVLADEISEQDLSLFIPTTSPVGSPPGVETVTRGMVTHVGVENALQRIAHEPRTQLDRGLTPSEIKEAYYDPVTALKSWRDRTPKHVTPPGPGLQR